MGHVDMTTLRVGATYSRKQLADMWGYEGYRAFARGVFTPSRQPIMLLFISHEHDEEQTQNRNSFDGTTLSMDGEINHANDRRIVNSKTAGDEIHLFYREARRAPFTYHGQFVVRESLLKVGDNPSHFELVKLV
jgi:putative restriction endonuclease